MRGIATGIIRFFAYNHRETTGILVLIVVTLMVRTVPRLIYPGNTLSFSIVEQEQVDSFLTVSRETVTSPGISWFAFDPNTISSDSLKILGLRRDLSKRLVKLRSAGFHYSNASDLLRVYGMDTSWYKMARPWIRIGVRDPNQIRSQKRPTIHHSFDYGKRANERKKVYVDIVNADSVSLTSIPGIGPVLSSRIVKYRKALGGFHTTAQLKEVYGLDSVRFSMIEPFIFAGDSHLQKIVPGEDRLERHPYLTKKQALAINRYTVAHPNQPLTGENIHLVRALDSMTISRIRPYLP